MQIVIEEHFYEFFPRYSSDKTAARKVIEQDSAAVYLAIAKKLKAEFS